MFQFNYPKAYLCILFFTMQESFPDKMRKFISKHHVLTLTTCSNNRPWSCSCFYAFDPEENSFIITSDKDTRHVSEGLNQPIVSLAIALETKVIGRIQGIQFEAEMLKPEGEQLKRFRRLYLQKFPIAALHPAPFWVLKINTAKMTDNRLGFGRKLYWPDNKSAFDI